MADGGLDDLVAVYRRADRSVRRARGGAAAVAIFAVLSFTGAVMTLIGAVFTEDEGSVEPLIVSAVAAALSGALLWAVSAALEVLASLLEVAAADTEDE